MEGVVVNEIVQSVMKDLGIAERKCPIGEYEVGLLVNEMESAAISLMVFKGEQTENGLDMLRIGHAMLDMIDIVLKAKHGYGVGELFGETDCSRCAPVLLRVGRPAAIAGLIAKTINRFCESGKKRLNEVDVMATVGGAYIVAATISSGRGVGETGDM